jgi:hypothetical protein
MLIPLEKEKEVVLKVQIRLLRQPLKLERMRLIVFGRTKNIADANLHSPP